MTKKQKLELTWIVKEARPKLEPRILRENLANTCHAEQRASDKMCNYRKTMNAIGCSLSNRTQYDVSSTNRELR